jgi:hypothetical protein
MAFCSWAKAQPMQLQLRAVYAEYATAGGKLKLGYIAPALPFSRTTLAVPA